MADNDDNKDAVQEAKKKLESVIEQYAISKLHNKVTTKLSNNDRLYIDFTRKYNSDTLAGLKVEIDNKCQDALEDIMDTQSKMHDFLRLLRSIKPSDRPSPDYLLSTPLSCDLSLKCQRMYAKFATIKNKLDVYKHEMHLNDSYIKEKKGEIAEVMRSIESNLLEMNEKLTSAPSIPAASTSHTTVNKSKDKSVHGLRNINKHTPVASKEPKHGQFGVNKGGSVSWSPAVGDSSYARKSPDSSSRPVNGITAMGRSSGPPYSPISPLIYEVSSQLGRQFTENNKNRQNIA